MSDFDFLQHLDAITKHLLILNQSRPTSQVSQSYELLQQLFIEVLNSEEKDYTSINQELQRILVTADSGTDGN